MNITVSISSGGVVTTLEDCGTISIDTECNHCEVSYFKTRLSFDFDSVVVYPNGNNGATFSFSVEGKKK